MSRLRWERSRGDQPVLPRVRIREVEDVLMPQLIPAGRRYAAVQVQEVEHLGVAGAVGVVLVQVSLDITGPEATAIVRSLAVAVPHHGLLCRPEARGLVGLKPAIELLMLPVPALAPL